jgi:hypothetical protein
VFIASDLHSPLCHLFSMKLLTFPQLKTPTTRNTTRLTPRRLPLPPMELLLQQTQASKSHLQFPHTTPMATRSQVVNAHRLSRSVKSLLRLKRSIKKSWRRRTMTEICGLVSFDLRETGTSVTRLLRQAVFSRPTCYMFSSISP